MDTIGDYNALQINYVTGGCEMQPGFFYKNYSKILPQDLRGEELSFLLIQSEQDIEEYNRVLQELSDSEDEDPILMEEREPGSDIKLGSHNLESFLKYDIEGSKAEIYDALFSHHEILSSTAKYHSASERNFIIKSELTGCIYWVSCGTESMYTNPEIDQMKVWYEIGVRKLFNHISY
jgi:hypothetical protein